MSSFLRELRYAFRSLMKTPQFTGIAVLTLALGIGANTAIFSLLDHLLFRNLAVTEPERLVRLEIPGVFAGATWGGDYCIDHPMFRDLEAAPKDLFLGVAAVFHAAVSVSVDGATERGTAMLISGSGFGVFGLQPAAGRLFTEADDQHPGGHPLVVLSHGYWKRRFQLDPAVVGKSILVNNRPMTIIGVGPEGFRGTDFDSSPEVYVPMRMKAWITPTWDELDNPVYRWLQVYARLAPGISRQQAEERVQLLKDTPFQRYLQRAPVREDRFVKEAAARRVLLLPAGKGFSPILADGRDPLFIMMGLVFCVLLIACANISGLLIARFLRRQKELAIRLAIGAGSGSILRLIIMESLLLSAGGCLLSLVFAEWGGSLLIANLPDGGLNTIMDTVVDLRVLLFTIGTSFLVAAIFSLAPSLSFNFGGMLPALKQGAGNVSAGAGGMRLRKLLVAGQIAICLPVMLGATLFLRTLNNIHQQDLGVGVRNVIQFQVDPLLNGYEPQRIQAFYRQLSTELGAMPGVEAVGLAHSGMFTGDSSSATMTAPGEEPPAGRNRSVLLNRVSPSFFQTMGIPILLGRPIAESDTGSARVGVINEETARRFFGSQNPLGRQLCFGLGKDDSRCAEIVGVVRNAKQSHAREDQQAIFYSPYMQASDTGELTVYMRGSVPAEQMFAIGRQILRRLDGNLPLFNMRRLEDQLIEDLVVERLLSGLTTSFGLLSTLLAAIGLYGVMAFLVASRTKEIGVRMALGAQTDRVVGLVLRDAGWMVAVGVFVGLPLCYLLGMALQSQLYGVEPWDPVAIASASLVLLGAASCAGIIPASVAARVNPMTALRNE